MKECLHCTSGYCVCCCDLCLIKSHTMHLPTIDQSPGKKSINQGTYLAVVFRGENPCQVTVDRPWACTLVQEAFLQTKVQLGCAFRPLIGIISQVWFTSVRGETFVINLTKATLCFLSSLWSLEEDMRLVTGECIADMVMTVETKEDTTITILLLTYERCDTDSNSNKLSHIITHNLSNSAMYTGRPDLFFIFI